MKIEKQVCSLELAKKLKELGFTQSGYFYWEIGLDGEPLLVRSYIANEGDKPRLFSAFTVAELGEMLPTVIQNAYSPRYELEYEFPIKNDKRYSDQDFIIRYRSEDNDKNIGVSDKSEANARAKMLVYLTEKKLL